MNALSKIKFKDSILDLGGNPGWNNIVSEANIGMGNNIEYADQNKTHKDTIKIDLETDTNVDIKFSNVTIINVLEHIKNYDNALKLCNKILKNNGTLIGSTPFMFKLHFSPNDYFRFTSQLLEEELVKNGFDEIEITNLGLGPFTNFYSTISDYGFTILPLLNVIILIPLLILDSVFRLFNKNFVKYYPLGYFFSAKKKD